MYLNCYQNHVQIFVIFITNKYIYYSIRNAVKCIFENSVKRVIFNDVYRISNIKCKTVINLNIVLFNL